MSPLRIAVIGAGHLGQIHVRLLRGIQDVTIAAVADPDADARRHVAQEYQVATCAGIDDLPSRLDAAIIAAPSPQHAELGQRLLARGLHLLVEKPLATTAADADALCQAAARHRRILQVGHVERYNPAWALAQTLVRNPLLIEAHRLAPYAFRSSDVGVVMDLMIHDLDLTLAMVGSEVVRVAALGCSFFGAHEDLAQARLEFRNGAVAHLTASRVSSSTVRTWHLVAPGITARVDLAEHRLELVRPRPDTVREHARVCALPADRRRWYRDHLFETVLARESIGVAPSNPLAQELADFVAAIRGERTVPVDGPAGASAVSLAERILDALAANTSDATQRFLRSEPDARRRIAG